jgi:hypothetical protein
VVELMFFLILLLLSGYSGSAIKALAFSEVKAEEIPEKNRSVIEQVTRTEEEMDRFEQKNSQDHFLNQELFL